jgi:hypothetical protein
MSSRSDGECSGKFKSTENAGPREPVGKFFELRPQPALIWDLRIQQTGNSCGHPDMYRQSFDYCLKNRNYVLPLAAQRSWLSRVRVVALRLVRLRGTILR